MAHCDKYSDFSKGKRMLFKYRKNRKSVKIMSKGSDKIGAFWILLKMLGMNSSFPERNYVICEKTQFISFIFLSVSVVCYLSIMVKNVIHGRLNIIHSVILVLYAIIGVCEYFCLLRKNDKIKLLRKVIDSLPVERSVSVWLLIYGMISLSIMRIAVIPYVYFNFAKERLIFFTMDCFEDQRLKSASIIVTAWLFMAVDEAVPSFLNCIFCAVCYQWVRIISSVKNEMRRMKGEFLNDDAQSDSVTGLLEKCLNIWHDTDLVKETFSSFLFFSITREAVIIFAGTAFFLKMSGDTLGEVDIATIIGINIFQLTMTVFISSRIPDEMEKIVKTMTDIHEEKFLKNRHMKYMLVDIRMLLIMKKLPTALSVGGFADLKISFLFGIFGTLVTYGLIALDLV